jgi:hypothetical protein
LSSLEPLVEPVDVISAMIEANISAHCQRQLSIIFMDSSHLNQILISVPTRLANTLMRNENQGAVKPLSLEPSLPFS